MTLERFVYTLAGTLLGLVAMGAAFALWLLNFAAQNAVAG